MPLGFGKGSGHNNEEFVPTDGEKDFLKPFLENRDVSFLDVKKQILERDDILQDRRERLGEWFRDARAQIPSSGIERGITF